MTLDLVTVNLDGLLRFGLEESSGAGQKDSKAEPSCTDSDR